MFRMMHLDNFTGGIIAKNRSAYYLLGCIDYYLLYLDPHKV